MKEDLISARLLARVCGQCVAMTRAVAPGKLLLRNAYRLLSSRTSWSDKLTLDAATRSDLLWWESALGPNGWNVREISIRPIDVQIETDASDSGWGGYILMDIRLLETGPGLWRPSPSTIVSYWQCF